MIQVDVSSTLKRPIDKKLLDRAARAVLSGRMDGEVSITVVGDARMRRLHHQSLGIDSVTDVLSFDHGETPEGRMVEIIVCEPHADRQARRYGVPLKQELARYVVHGALHCVGFDDHDDGDRSTMWREQERVLRKLFGRSYRATDES